MQTTRIEKEITETIKELEAELESISRFNYSEYECEVLRKKIKEYRDLLDFVKEPS